MLSHFDIALHGAFDSQVFFATTIAFDGDPLTDGGFFQVRDTFNTNRRSGEFWLWQLKLSRSGLMEAR